MSETLTHPDEGAAFVSEQDAALRRWTHGTPGHIKIGSDEHRKMFCRMLLHTHDPYRPAVLDWPKLEPDALGRLTSLPIWDIAVQTEGRASIRVKTYARTLNDPLLCEAIEMDAAEEARHKVVVSHLVQAYGVETFEPVIAHHILFFVNWVAWCRKTMPWWRRPWHSVRVAAIWFMLVWERLAIARGFDADGHARDSNFLPANREVLGDSLAPRAMIELCLEENDARLLRPTFVPTLARFALRLLKK